MVLLSTWSFYTRESKFLSAFFVFESSVSCFAFYSFAKSSHRWMVVLLVNFYIDVAVLSVSPKS